MKKIIFAGIVFAATTTAQAQRNQMYRASDSAGVFTMHVGSESQVLLYPTNGGAMRIETVFTGVSGGESAQDIAIKMRFGLINGGTLQSGADLRPQKQVTINGQTPQISQIKIFYPKGVEVKIEQK